jgi:hypothetical protein
MTPYFNSEEIEKIINNPNLAKQLIGENFGYEDESGEDEAYEAEEEYEDEAGEHENDVESMSDKEKVKLAYEILSMTSYEDEIFMKILGRLRKLMR